MCSSESIIPTLLGEARIHFRLIAGGRTALSECMVRNAICLHECAAS
jgi:hypothetical protein